MPEARIEHPGSHRSRILSSIRSALGESADAGSIASQYNTIQRTYQQSSALNVTALVELFTDRLHEYDAGVYSASAASIRNAVADILSRRGYRRIAIPAGLPSAWLPDGVEFVEAQSFDKLELDRVGGILSGCTVAIAETGTFVLQNAAAQGPRLLSLVPDYHLCVIFVDQIVATVPEAFARLSETANLPTTFISGPSATADIEMTRIKGVHGPRFLDVLLVQD